MAHTTNKTYLSKFRVNKCFYEFFLKDIYFFKNGIEEKIFHDIFYFMNIHF